MRFIGERRAIAAAVLSFFMLQLLLSGLLDDSPLRPVFVGLGVAYLVAFLGIVAGWFWARWYTLGLAFSGIVLAAITGWQNGLIGLVYVLGGSHLAVALALLGDDAATFYDGRRDWRDRWKMDENAVNRLGKAVTRAGASLPYLIVAGLAPKQGMGLGIAALLLGVAGLGAIVRLRTWGVFALAGAAGVAFASTFVNVPLAWVPWGPAPWIAAALLTAAVIPFAAPIGRSLRRD